MLYDITKSFEENIAYGPVWNGKLPHLPDTKTFLGQRVNSLFGIAACPLTINARFVGLVGKLGFDILTYKSVRSVEWHGNPYPHWFYVDAPAKTNVEAVKSFTASAVAFPKQEVSMANSFGIQSTKPEYWQPDFILARKNLAPGQLLILSMQTTRIPEKKIVDDAKDLAKLALEAGAEVVEINFACPNTDEGKGMIFDDVDLAPRVCEAMKQVLESVPLLIKVGFYKDNDSIREIMLRTRGVISGISTVNTYPGKIVDKKGKDAFPNRPWAGVSGAVIRTQAMKQTATMVKLKGELGLSNFVVIGIGGVTKPQHIGEYFDIGVDAVQSAAGAYADPYLAIKYKKSMYDGLTE